VSVNLGSIEAWGDIGKQFLVWQVLSQIANAILGPALVEVTQDINGKVSRVALSPADATDAVVKGHWTQAQGAQEASLSGIDGDRFQILVDAAGEPPGLETLLEMWRRGIIERSGGGAESTSLEQGIRESRLKNKWVGAIEAIRTAVLPPGQSVAAALRGNLPYDAAKQKAYEAGIAGEDFDTMVHNAGNPPSPGELAELVHRGLIPVGGTGPDALTYQQGIFEGDTKNKWWELLLKAAEYIPPPRTVTALLKEGVITPEMATAAFKAAGMTDEWAQAYTQSASAGSKSQSHDLTKSEVLQLYADSVIDRETALADLRKLGLNEQDAGELIDLQDAKREHALVQQVITHLRSLYVAGKIDAQTVVNGLTNAGVADAERQQLLKLWNLEKGSRQTRITGAEAATAYRYGLLDGPTAMALLQSLGYSEFEAWLRLAVTLHGEPKDVPRPPTPAF
jgi:hypothetical protein